MFALIAVVLFGLGVLLFVGAVYINSSAHPKPFLDRDGKPLAGSISEKVFVEINGLKQGLIIKGKSLSNPVLLYLHGGMPDFFLTQALPDGAGKYLHCGVVGAEGNRHFLCPQHRPENPEQSPIDRRYENLEPLFMSTLRLRKDLSHGTLGRHVHRLAGRVRSA